jgi:hypothetical protein
MAQVKPRVWLQYREGKKLRRRGVRKGDQLIHELIG